MKLLKITFCVACMLCLFIPNKLDAQQRNTDTNLNSSGDESIEFECVPCEVIYSKFSAINADFDVLPDAILINLPTGGQVNLSNRFVDADAVKYKGSGCPPGVALNTNTPFERFDHQSRFEVTKGASNASFNIADPAIDLLTLDAFPIRPFMDPSIPGDFKVYQSENAVLHAANTWTSGSIKVTVDVIDNATNPTHPATYVVSGTCQDKVLSNHFTWRFRNDNDIPLALKQEMSNPTEGNWTNMDPLGYEVDYTYKGVESCMITTNDYSRDLITENFTGDGVPFTLNDLRTTWLMSEGITTLDEAIERIFRTPPLHGPSASFTFDSNSKITDTHGLGVTYNDSDLLNIVFKTSALSNDRIGYFINQEYRTADNVTTLLGTAVVNRVLRVITGTSIAAFHIKKDHSATICN